MSDLITLARAKHNLNNLVTTAAEDATLTALISACSRAIENYCRRRFASQSLDELYQTVASDKLILNEYPILSVSRVATSPTPVLRIINQSSVNQRATVAVTANGLTLIRVTAGESFTDTSITWNSHATLNGVQNAVNALGGGWHAVVASGYEEWASADLRSPQGALNARGGYAVLKIHVRELSNFEIDAERGWLLRRGGEPLAGNVRVVYTAGYASIPDDVQEACAVWVAALFWQTKRDPGLIQDALTGTLSRSSILGGKGALPLVRHLLQPYRRLPITSR
ncbi:MAG: head-tail connector protein [Gemmataceae bacterium]